MEAHLSSRYAQMTIFLSEADIRCLRDNNEVHGQVFRHPPNDRLPLHIRVTEGDRMNAQGLPPEVDAEDKTSYEVILIPKAVDLLEEGKAIGIEFPVTMMRKVTLEREPDYWSRTSSNSTES